jgi:hypothetical protein
MLCDLQSTSEADIDTGSFGPVVSYAFIDAFYFSSALQPVQSA